MRIKHLCILIWAISIPINPAICDHFFGENPEWWYMFKDLVTLVNLIGAFGLFQFAKYDRVGKFLSAVLLGFSLTDVIEKWIFNDRTKFCIADLIGIFVVVFFTYYEQILHPFCMDRFNFYNKIINKFNGTKV